MEWLSRLIGGLRRRPQPNLEPWLLAYRDLIGGPREGKPFVLTRERGQQVLIDRPAFEQERGQRKGAEPSAKELDEAVARSDRVRIFEGGVYEDEPLGVVILLDSMDPLLLNELRAALAMKETLPTLRECRGLGSPTLEFTSGTEQLATVSLREGRYVRLPRWRRDAELVEPEALQTLLKRLHIEADQTNDVDTMRSLHLLSLSRAERHAQRAESYRVQGLVARAVEECERALAIDPACWMATRARAALHHQQGEFEPAEARYTEALKLGAPPADTLRMRALAKSSSGRHGEALEDCEKASRVAPGDGEVHMTRAMILMAMNRQAEARQALDLAERNSRNKAAMLWNRAMLEYEISCFPQATEALDRLIAHMKEPGYTPPRAAGKEAGAHRDLSLDLCSAHLQRARARANMNLHDEAFEDFAQAQKHDPLNLLTYEWRALLHQQRDEFGPALRDCDRMIELSPCETSYVYRAHVRAESGDLEAALDDLADALDVATEPHRIHGIRGQLLLNAERITEARAEFDDLLAIKPDEAAAYYLRSRCWRHLGIYEEQRDDLVQALAIEPENIFALNSLSWLYSTCPDEEIRNGKQAVELGRKAVSATGGANPHFLDTLAAGHAEVEEFDAACQLMRRAIAIFKNHLPPQALEEYRNRLSVYESEEPYRES